MNRAEFRPFKIEHLINIVRIPNEEGYTKHPNWAQWVKTRSDSDIIRSFFVDDHLVSVCGADEDWPGVAEVWVIFNDNLHRYAKSVVRATGQFLDWVQHSRRYHTIYADVLDKDVTVRYLRHYGFEVWGAFPHFSPLEQDMLRMARTKEEYRGYR